MAIKYTEEQASAISDCVEFIKSTTDTRKWYTLSGPPGAGKTVSILGVLSQFKTKKIVASAISHVATNILADHLKDVRLDTLTVAQLTGSVPSKSQKKIKFHINPNMSRIHNYDIILIDECSMLDTPIFNVLLTMKNASSKLIFIGDKYQLPPPEDGRDSPSLQRIDSELTKIMRFTGPINEIVTSTKNQQINLEHGRAANVHFINSDFGRNGRISKMESDTGYIFLNDHRYLVDLFVQEYNLAPEDINNVRMLLFRNKYVDITNDAIRSKLYGSNLHQFEPGEMVVSKGGYRKGKENLVFNRETYRVLRTEDGFNIGGVPCINMVLDPKPHAKGLILTPSVKENGIEIFNRILIEKEYRAEQTNNWRLLHDFNSQFAWWDYTYAQNLYLAQGKTYNSIFVIESEIHAVKPLEIKQKLQALYVGLSRAKKRLYIYNKKYKADGTSYTNTESFKKLFRN